ncbi:MAG: hypothetical protein LBK61_08090 [Spirochaetaceae bacterium]|jgi:hypothetical protein|nr:hypothetical protein [Spirochaetaceae bacterium]
MRRSFAGLVVLLGLLLVFWGCPDEPDGTDEGGSSPGEPPADPEAVTVEGFEAQWQIYPDAAHDGSAFSTAIIGTVTIFPGQTGNSGFTAPANVTAVLSENELTGEDVFTA